MERDGGAGSGRRLPLAKAGRPEPPGFDREALSLDMPKFAQPLPQFPEKSRVTSATAGSATRK
jgi:hypothetical protein